MEAKAYLYDLRISPRKVSIVLDLIRNKDVATAAGILANTRKAASEPVAKLLKSAQHGYFQARCFPVLRYSRKNRQENSGA